MAKVKSAKARTIYKKPGKPNLIKFSGLSGVYIIYREGLKRPDYIGYSGSDLYKTITRHFQSWDDPRQKRVSFTQDEKRKVKILLCSPGRALKIESLLIAKFRPIYNPKKISLLSIPAKDQTKAEEYINDIEPLEADF